MQGFSSAPDHAGNEEPNMDVRSEVDLQAPCGVWCSKLSTAGIEIKNH